MVNSCGMGYVGQTGRSFKTRYKEHQQRVKHGRSSTFGTHAFDNEHAFNRIEDTMHIVKTNE